MGDERARPMRAQAAGRHTRATTRGAKRIDATPDRFPPRARNKTAAAAQAAIAGPVVIGQVRTLSLAMPWPPGIGVGRSATRLARRIEAATEGRLRIEPRRAQVIGIDAVMSGETDLYHASEHHNLHHDEAFAHFAGLPFFSGLEPIDLEAWVTVGGGQHAWDKLAEPFGIKALLCGHSGRAPGLWSTQPIDGIADLLHGPVATGGLAVRILADLGGKPVVLSPAELRLALERKSVMAVEHGGAALSEELGLPTVARFHMGFGLNTAGTAYALGMSARLWARLTDSERTILEACCTVEFHRALAEARAGEAVSRTRLAATGVRFSSPPPGVLTALAGATDRLVADLGRHWRRAGRTVHESYHGFKCSLSPAAVLPPAAPVGPLAGFGDSNAAAHNH